MLLFADSCELNELAKFNELNHVWNIVLSGFVVRVVVDERPHDEFITRNDNWNRRDLCVSSGTLKVGLYCLYRSRFIPVTEVNNRKMQCTDQVRSTRI